MFECFVFDLDGTILDSIKDITLAVNNALKEFGKPPLKPKEVKKYVGYGGRKLIESIFKEPDIVDKALETFRKYYSENPCVHSKLFPYTKQIFRALKKDNKAIVILTNKYENISKDIVKTLGLDNYVDMILGADTFNRRKPDPYGIIYVIESFKLEKQDVILIGDTEVDIQTAKNAGIKSVFIKGGYINDIKKALSFKPDFVFCSLKDFYVEFIKEKIYESSL